jgi:hypothetical protein
VVPPLDGINPECLAEVHVDEMVPSTYAERYAAAKAAIDSRSCPLCGAPQGELCFAEDAQGQLIRAVDTTHVARLDR